MLKWMCAVNKTVLDNQAAKNLIDYATTNANVFARLTQSCINFLAYKVKKNTFDFEKSIKLWEYYADSVAKTYCLERHNHDLYWHTYFNKTTRKYAAKEFANYYYCAILEASRE